MVFGEAKIGMLYPLDLIGANAPLLLPTVFHTRSDEHCNILAISLKHAIINTTVKNIIL